LFLKRNNKNLFNIHIQNPKVNFSNFDLIVAPEHDQIKGSNVLSTFGALHYITKQEIDNSGNFFSKYNLSEKDKIVSLILGGPNRYYDFNEIDLGNIFLSIKDNFLDKGFKLILVRSRRTPDNIIDFAKKFFLNSAVIIDFVSKDFYLSALKLSKTIIVTCDSTSMISECAITQKPIFVAKMKPKRRNNRFEYFLNSFREKGIIKFLGENLNKTEFGYVLFGILHRFNDHGYNEKVHYYSDTNIDISKYNIKKTKSIEEMLKSVFESDILNKSDDW
jgi:mitochondrial fission protein ELM1